MVARRPADVVIVNLDFATTPIVPAAPPIAGPDRAYEPWEPNEEVPPPENVVFGDAEPDVARPTESPIAATVTVAAVIDLVFLFENQRRSRLRRCRAGSLRESTGPVTVSNVKAAQGCPH